MKLVDLIQKKSQELGCDMHLASTDVLEKDISELLTNPNAVKKLSQSTLLADQMTASVIVLLSVLHDYMQTDKRAHGFSQIIGFNAGRAGTSLKSLAIAMNLEKEEWQEYQRWMEFLPEDKASVDALFEQS